MTQYKQTANKLPDYLDILGGWNPQLLREIKGKLKAKNLIIVTAIALLTQFLIVIAQLARLPDASQVVLHRGSETIYAVNAQYSRYCTGSKPKFYGDYLCYQDMHNHWVINWQLFWFDLFVVFSVIGIALLLILGTYFLISNIVSEQKKGTLNLIRLSPQSATNIIVGKLLGVPALLYWFITLGLPLQIIAGLQADIPLSLVVSFDLAILASCAFFYSVSLLIGLVTNKSISALLFSIVITIFLYFSTILSTESYSLNTATLLDWFFLFNPNNLLLYVGKTTGIPYHHFNYFNYNLFGHIFPSSYDLEKVEPIALSRISFYGQALWAKVGVGIGIVIANYCLWTYWIWQGLKRRFYNLENTVINKQQSYWITGYFVAIALGFSLQATNDYYLPEHLVLLEFFLLIFFVGLTFAISPQHQTLQDWARYRHQMNQKGSVLWRELMFGEKSPSTVAIAINTLIATLYIVPTLIIHPLGKDTLPTFWGLILGMGIILFYCTIAQSILLSKNNYKVAIAFGVIISLIILPPVFLGFNGLYPEQVPLAWLFTFAPFIGVEQATLSTIALGILGQWLAITLVSLQITRKLRQAGRSQTSRILDNKVSRNVS